MITIDNRNETFFSSKLKRKVLIGRGLDVRSFIVSLLLLSCLLLPAHAKADTIFKSGFENGVTMSGFIPGTKWTKEISGSDEGYDWDKDIPGGSGNFWNLILDSSEYPDPSECMDLDISSNQSRTGSKSLHMRVKKKCDYDGVNARVSYLTSMGLWPHDETHIKYWLYLPSSFEKNMKLDQDSATANFNEIRMGSSDLRIVFDIVSVAGGDLKFRIWAEDISAGWNPHWIKTSDDPVPINRWFHVEIYFNVKTYAEGGGAFWVKIDGKKILETIPDATTRICGKSVDSATCDNPSDWNLIKLYTWEGNPIEAYLDDFEIYDKLTPTINEAQNLEAPFLRVVEKSCCLN